MNILLAFFSASAHSVNSVALRLYQTRLQQKPADLRLYQSLYMFLAAFGYLLCTGLQPQLDGAGLALALCYGLDLALTGTLVTACYLCGPMSVTSVITNACVALPIAVGCIFYREVMTLPQILGCLLLGALGLAGMWAAIFADVGVMVLAVLNAMRALNTKG